VKLMAQLVFFPCKERQLCHVKDGPKEKVHAMEGKMGKSAKMKEVTESQLERMVRAGLVQVEDRCENFVVLMDCETFRCWTARVATWRA
jgi:hypothetical protein